MACLGKIIPRTCGIWGGLPSGADIWNHHGQGVVVQIQEGTEMGSPMFRKNFLVCSMWLHVL